MTVATPVIYTLVLLFFTVINALVYFAIFFMIWYVIGFGMVKVFRPLFGILKGKKYIS